MYQRAPAPQQVGHAGLPAERALEAVQAFKEAQKRDVSLDSVSGEGGAGEGGTPLDSVGHRVRATMQPLTQWVTG